MEPETKYIRLRIGGMTCVGCERRIERALLRTRGVTAANVSYSTSVAEIAYVPQRVSQAHIKAVIEEAGYSMLYGSTEHAQSANRIVGLLLIIVALYVLLSHFGVPNLLAPSRLAETNMRFGMMFVIGLITSVHCVAMCGGINLSQCIPQNKPRASTSRISALRPTLLYNLGRVISYTIVGFIVGGLGSVITFSSAAQGLLKLTAGVFMVIMGVNMLGTFPWLRKLTPRMPRVFSRGINAETSQNNSPLIVGLLNGLMPCGPLQAMQIYALSTGNPVAGALSMLLFSLGTVPLMFGLGALSSVLSKRFTHKVMTGGAVLVVVLGLSMLSQGWILSGVTLPPLLPGSANASQGTSTQAEITAGVQLVTSTLESGRYPAITVQAGMPVKWTIEAPKGSINGCNNAINIPEYDIEYKFKEGENVIAFIPDKAGQFRYSCWMGMIRGTITVIEPSKGEAS